MPIIEAMTGRRSAPTIIGRDRELDIVAGRLGAALEGSPTHLLVSGEAGIGKTRLVTETTRLATERGMRVLLGACANLGDGGVPYGPIVEAIRGLSRDLAPEDLAAVVGPSGDDLARLVPALSPTTVPGAGGDLGTLQARVLEALLGLLQRLAEREPVLLVMEDLHWADPATRDSIAFIVRNLRSDRILLFLTFRSDELHRRHPLMAWLAELERSGRVERLDLERLDPARTNELLNGILGEEPAARLADRIHERSDGNPFFIEELVMAGDAARERGALPPTLRGILVTRLAAAPDLAQTVIGAAAVAGRRVEHGLLAAVAGLDEPDLLDGLRSAVSNQLLVVEADPRGGDVYAFRHALLQEAAYEELLPGERRRLHRALAEALAEQDPGAGVSAAWHWSELAFHWSAARDELRAFEASVRAGEAAERNFAFADAARHDERALDTWSSIEDAERIAGMDRITLLGRAAQSVWLSGDARRAVAWRREAVASMDPATDPTRAAILQAQLSRSLWNLGDTQQALVASTAAVAAIDEQPPSAAKARVLAGHGQLLMLLDRCTESRDICLAAIEIAREVGARDVEGHARNTLGLDLAAEGRCTEALASLDLALAIAKEIADTDDIGRAYANRGEALARCGETERALKNAEEGIGVNESFGGATTYGRFLRADGVRIAYELGRWDEARRLMAHVVVRDSGPQVRRYDLSRWVELLVASGDPDARPLLDELADMQSATTIESQFHGPFWMARAEQQLWDGRPAQALETVREGLAGMAGGEWRYSQIELVRLGAWAAADLAELARMRRDDTALTEAGQAGQEMRSTFAPRLAISLEQQHGRDRDETLAQAATIDAELARLAGTATSDAWAAATERWQIRGRPYPLAYAQLRLAEARLGEGDRTGATDALTAAYAVAVSLGAAPLRAAIESLATRARVELASPDEATPTPEPVATAAAQPTDPFGLTRRELEVLALVAAGRTNRQIAESLFISESTAGVHVSNILGKLGVAGRTEAAGIAIRLGLVPA